MTSASEAVPAVFLAVSVEAAAPPGRRVELVRRAEQAARWVATDAAPPAPSGPGGPAAAVVTADDPGPDAGVLARGCATAAPPGTVDPSALRADAHAGLRLAPALAAPGGFWARHDGRALVASDPLGILQLHVVQGDGWAACSTSALALASLAGAGLDEEAISTFALLGVYAGCDTPFAGVRALAAGEACTLAGGRLERVPLGPPPADGPGAGAGRDPVDGGAAAVRAAVESAVAGHDAVHLELSGGLDSRLLLAALRQAPVAVTTMTVGVPGAPDVAVAGDLARRLGVPNEVVDLSGLGALAPADAWDLVRRAATGRDACGSAVAEGVLELVEDRSSHGPRMSGQNGELARGFYYAAQPPWPSPTPALVRALVRWRLTTNDAVDAALVDPDLRRAGHDRTVAAVERALRGYGRPWLPATDELYLDLRMRRWLGPEHSAASRRHPVLAPFFHPAFVAWARAAPPARKRGSRLSAAVLERLAPDLASLPLASGWSPRDLARRDAGGRAAALAMSAGKVAAKVGQRLRSSERPAVGAVALAAAVHEHWRANPVLLERAARLPFVEHEVVEQFLAGRRGLDVASTSFLVDLVVATDPRLADPG